MDIQIRDRFSSLWQNYFEGAELPITAELGEDKGTATKAPIPNGQKCIIGELMKVRKGTSMIYDQDTFPCEMGKSLLGYETKLDPNIIRYYLTSGIPGKMEGLRFRQTPEIIDEMAARRVPLPSKGKSFTFKRWDQLTSEDNPYVAIFFCKARGFLGAFSIDKLRPGRSQWSDQSMCYRMHVGPLLLLV